MRYTIIHHDVRKQFDLTVSEYLVCDSIHQLSTHTPCDKSNVEIATFLGIDEASVRRAKKTLEEKKLIFFQAGSGWKTTIIWADAVTYNRQNAEGARQNAEQLGKMPSIQYIKNIKNNNTAGAVFPPKEEIHIESEDIPKPRAPRNPIATKEYDELVAWMSGLTGAPIPNRGKQYAHLAKAKLAKISRNRLKARAEELWAQEYYFTNGMDWGSVVSSFDRKA